MTDAKDYISFRKNLLDFINTDLVGPQTSDEIITDTPIGRYAAGVLFPQITADHAEDPNSKLEDPDIKPADTEEVGIIDQTTAFYPSAMGLSFSVDSKVDKLSVSISAAQYRKITENDYNLISHPASSLPDEVVRSELFKEKLSFADGKVVLKAPISREEARALADLAKEDQSAIGVIYNLSRLFNEGWKRAPLGMDLSIGLNKKYNELPLTGTDLKIVCTVKDGRKNNTKLCTVTLVNTSTTSHVQTDHEKAYFQCGITVRHPDGAAVFNDLNRTKTLSNDPEEKSLVLLFRKKRFFAAGHGCSASWGINGKESKAFLLNSISFPAYEVPKTVFDLPLSEDAGSPDMRMEKLATESDEWIIDNLTRLTSLYGEWVKNLDREKKNLESELLPVADEHIKNCKETAARMTAGIALLQKNSTAMTSFRLANRAMLMQRIHTGLQQEKHFPDEERPMPSLYSSDKERWRPFQIAFILMTIESIVNKEDTYRDIVDLIWFPTGGGKTEAYLGLSAFTIFFRRLTNDDAISGGTTVLMRYTLRLLTSQQFQRACTLICACEKIRREHNKLGTDVISIGLWLGKKSTPNTVKQAQEKIEELNSRQEVGLDFNPFQVLSCPWCGTHMMKRDGKGINSYKERSRPQRLSMWCPNSNCDFYEELPVKVVDEDIYNDPPTLLFGTVDKFALLPWYKETANIFALDQDNTRLSPELIIQDELHLISGALGTIVGVYETAIDLMCSKKGSRPKIVASTATIRRASEQCRALYARGIRQFPPQGLDSSDSFFAREASDNKTDPGRLYVGIMPTGKTSTTMEVRLLTNAMQSVYLIEADDEIKDKYWTQVVYCNSIKELGASKSMVNDDVREYAKRFRERYGAQRFNSDRDVVELTSRVSAESIPEILQRLNTPYANEGGAISVLLATNMISVGVDIDRLGLMTIIGQPKTSSEYIQASSRVGRKYPGIIFTLYSPVKSRDRSHYERFVEYHQSYYKHVEPTSVTPFSPPARDKAMPAVIFSLVRHLAGYHTDEELAAFDPDNKDVKKMTEDIMERIGIIDSAEATGSYSKLHEVLNKITQLKQIDGGVSYSSSLKGKNPLMRQTNDHKGRGSYPVPQSMRNTDSECYISIDHSV